MWLLFDLSDLLQLILGLKKIKIKKNYICLIIYVIYTFLAFISLNLHYTGTVFYRTDRIPPQYWPFFISILTIGFIFILGWLNRVRLFIHISSLSEEKQAQLLLGCLLLFTIAFIFLPVTIGNKLLIYYDTGNDTRVLYTPIYSMLSQKIIQADFTWWEFSYGTGVNLLSFQSIIFDPFGIPVILVAALFGQATIAYTIVIMFALRIICAAYLCYKYLSFFKFSPWAKAIASYVYGFNGFLILFGQHYYFGTACVYVMLILVCIEKSFLSKKSFIYLALTCFGICVFTFYFAYMILLFTAAYLFIRLIQIYTIKQIAKALKHLFSVGASILVGMLMAMAVFFPSVIDIMLTSQRLESTSFLNYLGLYSPHILKEILFRIFSNNLLGIAEGYEGPNNYYASPEMFFSSFFLIVLFQFLYYNIKEKKPLKVKLVFLMTTLLLLFATLVPLIPYMLHGFTYPTFRHTFLFMPIFAYIFAWTCQEIFIYKKLNVSILVISVIVGILVSSYSSGKSQLATVALAVLLLINMLIVLFVLPLYKRCNAKYQHIIICLFVVILMVNMTTDSFVTLNMRNRVDSSSNVRVVDTDNALDYIKNNDDQFFRIEKNYFDFCINDSLVQNYNGVSTYNSVINANVRRFYEELLPDELLNPNYLQRLYNHETPIQSSILGIKYLLSRYEISSPDFILINTIDDIYVYRNKKLDGIGLFYDKIISESDFLELTLTDRTEILKNHLVLDYDEITTKDHNIEYHDQSSFLENSVRLYQGSNDSILYTESFSVHQAGYVYFPIPYQSGWTVKENGIELEIYKANFGFTAVHINEGTHQLDIEYKVPGANTGLILSAIGFACFVTMLLYNKYRS